MAAFKIDDLVTVRQLHGIFYVYYVRYSIRGQPLYYLKCAATHQIEEGSFPEHDLLPLEKEDLVVEVIIKSKINRRRRRYYFVKWG